MGSGTEKRSDARGMTDQQLRLWPDQPEGGGSAGQPGAARRGGGYQNTRTALTFLKKRARSARGDQDPRIEDLRAARLGAVWIRVAERVGFEAFMQVWQTLAESPEVLDDRSRVYVPCIQKFLAAQRNLLIRDMIAQGMRYAQIRRALQEQLGHAPSLSAIREAMTRARKTA